jgi:hypothetical protein
MTRKPSKCVELLPVQAAETMTPLRESYLPFPVELLPPVLASYVREGARALGCDAACLALPMLAAAASAIGNTRVLRLKPGWDEPSVLWAVVVGEGGVADVAAFRKAVAYLVRLQRTHLQEFRGRSAFHRNAAIARNAARRRAGGDRLDIGPVPCPPPLRRHVADDTFVESLAETLESNPRGLLVARHDLDGWLLPFTRTKAVRYLGRDRAAWLEMFLAGTLFVDRKSGAPGHAYIPRAAVSVAGSVRPRVLARLLKPDAPGAGLAGLLLSAMPPSVPHAWSEPGMGPEGEEAYHDLLGNLLSLEFEDVGRDKSPRVLSLSPEAKARWKAFYDARSHEQPDSGEEISLTDFRLEAYAARLALVHHVVSRVSRRESDLVPVEKESVEAGVALGRWFAAEARRIRAVLFESAAEHRRRSLFELIEERGGRISVRGLMRANHRRYPDAASAEKALGALVESGLARWSAKACQNGSPEEANLPEFCV